MKITIGLPIYNEEKTILQSLKYIFNALYELTDYEYEVLACFNGTTDSSIEKVNQSPYNQKIKKIFSDKGKAIAVRKIGLESDGDIIIFIDTDTKVDRFAFIRILETFENDNCVIGVSGRVIPYKKEQFFYKVINIRMIDYNVEVAKYPFGSYQEKPFLHGRFYAVKQSVFHHDSQIDKMLDSIGDDTFLTHYIIMKWGRKAICRNSDAYCYYQPVQSLKSWWNKRIRIWSDLKKLYSSNPQFKRLKPLMKTKVNFKYIIRQGNGLWVYVFIERLMYHVAYLIYGVLSLFKKGTWIRLDDTKSIRDDY